MPNFKKEKKSLIPAIIQDSQSQKVLMMGYMNEEAYKTTKKSGRLTLYSRSKKKLWTKGESSGNFLEVLEIREDCAHDALLVKVKANGPVCHKGSDTCFKEENHATDISFLTELAEMIKDRRQKMPEGSYTTKLFRKGINKIAQKVGEEAVELVIEAKDNDPAKLVEECADLMYHVLVLLEAKNSSMESVVRELARRHGGR